MFLINDSYHKQENTHPSAIFYKRVFSGISELEQAEGRGIANFLNRVSNPLFEWGRLLIDIPKVTCQ